MLICHHRLCVDFVILEWPICIHNNQLIMLDMGLNRMIFESRIHNIEVITVSTTPPHPKSRDHDVVNTRAVNKLSSTFPPKGITTPSTVPSASIAKRGLLCTLLKCIIVRVNNAKEAVKERMI